MRHHGGLGASGLNMSAHDVCSPFNVSSLATHNATQRNAAQRSATQRNTTQHNPAPRPTTTAARQATRNNSPAACAIEIVYQSSVFEQRTTNNHIETRGDLVRRVSSCCLLEPGGWPRSTQSGCLPAGVKTLLLLMRCITSKSLELIWWNPT
jgi:hypothetical protein